MKKNLKNAQDSAPPSDDDNDDAPPGAQPSDTIEHASAVSGYSVLFLQKLKARGCQAFRNGRVHVDEIETYIAENQEACAALERQCEETEAVDTDIKRERHRKLQLANDQAEGKVIDREFAGKRAEAIGTELRELLRAYLEDEQPRLLAGRALSEEAIRAENRAFADRMIKHFETGTAWTK